MKKDLGMKDLELRAKSNVALSGSALAGAFTVLAVSIIFYNVSKFFEALVPGALFVSIILSNVHGCALIDKKRLEKKHNAIKQFNELTERFNLKDYDKSLYNGEEYVDNKELCPYTMIMFWFDEYCRKRGLDFYESTNLTYKLIDGMQRMSYTNEEIAEYLMMTMASGYEEDKSGLKNLMLKEEYRNILKYMK